jgi:hypothetical protein
MKFTNWNYACSFKFDLLKVWIKLVTSRVIAVSLTFPTDFTKTDHMERSKDGERTHNTMKFINW